MLAQSQNISPKVFFNYKGRNFIGEKLDSHCLNHVFKAIIITSETFIAQLVKNPPAMQETPVRFLGWEDSLEKDRLSTPVFLGFPCGSAGKESASNADWPANCIYDYVCC